MSYLPEQHRAQIQAILAASPLVPVITIQDPAQALPLCEALVAGGIRVLEITLRTEHGLKAIEQVRQNLPDAWVGAGTVCTPAQYRDVVSAGAQFVISPGVTEALLELGAQAPVPLLPGVATVSELMMGYALGYREFKFFPAEVAGGTAALKAMAGPFPDVAFCPTGGIGPANAGDYLALANVRAVGGSWLTPADAVAAGDWQKIRELARSSLVALAR
ncbi:bifunctional 4-hydroxy-2-oxoglutarate aldolase/2-dehydro-3-deoxy-phosphogluconate aldolase [Marinobacter lutaoensis]|jgi:2-dehydro-3-deoxyphosphogluconate aldolase/(4S)-4-hydroxy-2-oxoglutarate aldolase|uniref:2-dehydro-3-deoxy-phosphogluconate aldolase n=1 Tax=Marinobacter lutaoensis TaxID=135739 RepID=A0A1V2DQU3_9GAMM|nr:bifunctional 4-hydroxy-2-oxoglutarate aldolase/2-dehydro-3-deoxy-phosphogluconate aldolase [Marinobacter lutaoensis]MBE02807.1 keto-deoxy-phosphogluconate aldolase [Marinobacter sp.]MBI44295.1 keto-deoxy-phosphogluconate aldolase [Oceanospirillales bacterium]ONF43042.1 keto-deoxy-phosphogluconate aldolase [Marinobacter lutaoensis]|tara:strand:+ start:170 stop:823 length:654 start_codon:yes stop_codon:yes gene_type:complete